MSRKVTFGSQEHTTVFACDERGAGNANHVYEILAVDRSGDTAKMDTRICFQNGPIKENGVNGIHNEDLLCIVMDRLEGFQAGDYACGENAVAFAYVGAALRCLRHRTEDRKKQGVEGTNVKRDVVPTPKEVVEIYNEEWKNL